MKQFTGLGLLLSVALLASCGGAGSTSLAPPVTTKSAAARTARMNLTVTRASGATSSARTTQNIPAATNSADIQLWLGTGASGTPIITSCVAFPIGSTTAVLTVTVPQGLQYAQIGAWSGPCSSPAGGQGTHGTGTLLSAFTGSGTVSDSSVSDAFNSGYPIILQEVVPTAIPTTTVNGASRIEGLPATTSYAPLDTLMLNYMQAHNVRAAQLAVYRQGKPVFSHAYTNSSDPTYRTTLTTSVMRIASSSKPLTWLAANQLIATGRIARSTLVFPYLGITAPLFPGPIDPQIDSINVGELIDETSGLPGEGSADPTFAMRSIEVQAGNTGPLTASQYTPYLFGVKLTSAPGAVQGPNNVSNYLLARVVERASGMRFIDYLDSTMYGIGIDDVMLTATAPSARTANEVSYDDPGVGLSVLDPTSEVLVPSTDGGATLFELTDGSSGIATSANSYAKMVSTYYSGVGFYCYGDMVGTASFATTMANGKSWTMIFNRDTESFSPTSTLVTAIGNLVIPL